MKPLAEHQTVLQVIREIVEEALLAASPALAVVTAVGSLGEVKVRLLDEEASRPLNQARNPSMRLQVGDTVLVIRTLANDLVVVCPVTSFVTQPTIGSEHLITGSVASVHLQNGSVGQAQLQTNAVITEKIGAGAVTFEKIQTGAVGSGKIAAGAVGTSQIAVGAVTADRIASGVIPTNFTPAANSITSNMLQNGAVTTDKINNGSVLNEKIADNTIAAVKLFQPNGVPFYANRDHQHPYANQTHTHNAADVNLNYQSIRCINITVRNASGVQRTETLASILGTLWSRSFGGSSGVAACQ